jgi:hypothetical protein
MKITPPPVASLLVCLAAFVGSVLAGGWYRSSNPFGVFLYTPLNRCKDLRINSFGFGYELTVLGLVVVLFAAMLVLWQLARKSNSQLSTNDWKRWAIVLTWSTILVALLGLLSPLSKWVLPDAPDPKCVQKQSPP